MTLTITLSPPRNPAWVHRIFDAKAVQTGGVVRRKVSDVEREIGRKALMDEVQRRGLHLVECGGQFLIICSSGPLQIHI